MTTNEQRQLGRAKNALLAYFERRISVPKIYIDADWDGHPIDVLAIDRDGVGDVHAVLLFTRTYFNDGQLNLVDEAEAIDGLIDRFQGIQAQFKYVAVVEPDISHSVAPFGLSQILIDKSFSPTGIGRIGFILIDSPLEGEPRVNVQIKPERFRAKIAKLADDYIQQHEPDWQVRA